MNLVTLNPCMFGARYKVYTCIDVFTILYLYLDTKGRKDKVNFEGLLFDSKKEKIFHK